MVAASTAPAKAECRVSEQDASTHVAVGVTSGVCVSEGVASAVREALRTSLAEAVILSVKPSEGDGVMLALQGRRRCRGSQRP
jgi:hypothetical protein